MFVFLLQAVLLLAIAYVLGAAVGCLLRTQMNPPSPAATRKPVAKPEPAAEKPAPSAVAGKPVAAEPVQPAAKKPAKPKGAAKKPAASAKSPKAATRTAPARKSAPASAGSDDLKRIKGVGPQIEAKLNAEGITRYEQIAGWKKKDVAEWGEKLSFSGRIEREDWVAQAKKLAKGETTDFARRVSKGEVPSSKASAKRGAGAKGKS